MGPMINVKIKGGNVEKKGIIRGCSPHRNKSLKCHKRLSHHHMLHDSSNTLIKKKFRAVVTTIIALNRLQFLGQDFQRLQNQQQQQQQQLIATTSCSNNTKNPSHTFNKNNRMVNTQEGADNNNNYLFSKQQEENYNQNYHGYYHNDNNDENNDHDKLMNYIYSRQQKILLFYNAKRKFKAIVGTIIAANRLQILGHEHLKHQSKMSFGNICIDKLQLTDNISNCRNEEAASSLSSSSPSTVLKVSIGFTAKRKFKALVRTIMAANRLQVLGHEHQMYQIQ